MLAVFLIWIIGSLGLKINKWLCSNIGFLMITFLTFWLKVGLFVYLGYLNTFVMFEHWLFSMSKWTKLSKSLLYLPQKLTVQLKKI